MVINVNCSGCDKLFNSIELNKYNGLCFNCDQTFKNFKKMELNQRTNLLNYDEEKFNNEYLDYQNLNENFIGHNNIFEDDDNQTSSLLSTESPLANHLRNYKSKRSVSYTVSAFVLAIIFFGIQLHLSDAQIYKQQFNTIPSAKQQFSTEIACEGQELKIGCDPNNQIDIIRANFGRFSIDICNDEHNSTLPTKCVTKAAHRIINKLCQDKQNCSVPALESSFGFSSCPGIPKYLEISYKCVSIRGSKRLNSNNNFPSLKNRLNPLNNSINELIHNSVKTLDTIYDSKSSNSAGIQINLPELDKKLTHSHSQLENNQNPFLYGGYRVPNLDLNNNNINDQVQYPNNLNTINEIKESPKIALLDHKSSLNLTNYCPNIKIKGASFDLTQAGKLVSVPCPAGAVNQVSWYCTSALEDGQRAMWYPKDKPDFSKCSSLWLNSMEDRLKEPRPMVSKLGQELAAVTNLYQDSFLNYDFNKQLHSIVNHDKHQQYIYARDLYRISEICSNLVNKVEAHVELNSEAAKSNEQRKKQILFLVHEMLANIQDTVSNLLVEQNTDSWLELQPTERSLTISSLMSSLKKNALLFSSVRPSGPSNFDRITRNIYIGIYVRQANNAQPLQLPVKRNIRSDGNVDSVTSENGDEESEDKQSRCCSILIPQDKINEQSVQNLAKFIFIVYEHLGQLMPIELTTNSKLKRSINTYDINNNLNQIPTPTVKTSSSSDKTANSISIVVSEIVSVFSQKESSSAYTSPNSKNDNQQSQQDKSEPYIELSFNHNKIGQQDNLRNYRCVQLQDSETVPYIINNRVLSVEQAALAVTSETNQNNQLNNGQISTTDFRFLAQTSNCKTIFTNLTQTTCHCTVLGTFTVIADLGLSDEMASQEILQSQIQYILNLNHTAIVSCAISAVLHLITIICFYFKKDDLKTINQLVFLRNTNTQLAGHLTFSKYQNILLSNQAKLNYLICSFFLQCAMLISLSLSESSHNNQIKCRFSSLAIHYFILVSLAWLLFDCFTSSYLLAFTETREQQQQQQQQTTTLFSNQSQPVVYLNSNGFTTTTTTTSNLDLQNSTRHTLLYTFKLLTYLLPLFIVVLSSWIDPSALCSKVWSPNTSLSNVNYAICWHVFDSTYIMFFIVPTIALVLSSIVIVVVSSVLRTRTKSSSTSQKSNNKKFTYFNSNQIDTNNYKPQLNSKNNLFLSNTCFNLFNILIFTCCWLSASFYLTNLIEKIDNLRFKQQQTTYAEPLLTANNLFSRTFMQASDSNLTLFAFLFIGLNVLNSVILLFKLGFQEGLIGQFCSPFFNQLLNICSSRSKESSINNNHLGEPFISPSYFSSNQQSDLETLKYDQKRFNLNKYDQNNSLNSILINQQRQPLVPAPKLINENFNKQQFNQNNLKLNNEVYENDEQHFSEQQSASETMLAGSDQQISEQSDSDHFLMNNQTTSYNDKFNNKEFYLKKNITYGHRNNLNQSARSQLEHYYECIKDTNSEQFYEPMTYSSAYGESDYPTQRLFNSNKYNRFINQQFSDIDSEYENPIEHINNHNFKSVRNNHKLLRNYSSNDFLNERDNQSKLDQPLLPSSIVRDQQPQFNLSTTNHLNFKNFTTNRFNIIGNNSFTSTIGRNELLSSSVNGLRNNSNLRNKKSTDIDDKEKNLKQIQNQLKQFQMQLMMNDQQQKFTHHQQLQDEELKDQQNCLTNSPTAQQNNSLSSNSVSDNVNSSV